MADRYTLSIYVAAPGTPLRAGGTSDAGHVYYGISDGAKTSAMGSSLLLMGSCPDRVMWGTVI